MAHPNDESNLSQFFNVAIGAAAGLGVFLLLNQAMSREAAGLFGFIVMLFTIIKLTKY